VPAQVDAIRARFSVQLTYGRRWPLKILWAVLDLGIINAAACYSSFTEKDVGVTDFARELLPMYHAQFREEMIKQASEMKDGFSVARRALRQLGSDVSPVSDGSPNSMASPEPHIPVAAKRGKRCPVCRKDRKEVRPLSKCEQCDVALCIGTKGRDCFVRYHADLAASGGPRRRKRARSGADPPAKRQLV
jgi:hypothetical protein